MSLAPAGPLEVLRRTVDSGNLSERFVDYHRQRVPEGSGSQKERVSFIGQRQKGHHSSFVQLLSLQESLSQRWESVQKSYQSFIYFDNKTEKKCKKQC